ncbi:MAG: DotU family type IV/VI secretion system protein [Bryobacteraceae bacterium]|nr:DotU family type IV/VI secretion system protein [Bryobacteraceae bacterium]
MASVAEAPVRRPENLALIFQEPLTVVERLRSNRQQVSDAATFRHQIRNALATSASQARQTAGYSSEDIKAATFAVVGFLDESVLNSHNPVFGDWPRKPLQEELFGTHMAGEVFFANLQKLLTRDETPDLADVLEVHLLCLLLGFRGRYSSGNSGDLHNFTRATAEKIQRIRGPRTELSPNWSLPAETARVVKDVWTLRLAILAGVMVLLAVVLFTVFKLGLTSGVSEIRAIAAQTR